MLYSVLKILVLVNLLNVKKTALSVGRLSTFFQLDKLVAALALLFKTSSVLLLKVYSFYFFKGRSTT